MSKQTSKHQRMNIFRKGEAKLSFQYWSSFFLTTKNRSETVPKPITFYLEFDVVHSQVSSSLRSAVISIQCIRSRVSSCSYWLKRRLWHFEESAKPYTCNHLIEAWISRRPGRSRRFGIIENRGQALFIFSLFFRKAHTFRRVLTSAWEEDGQTTLSTSSYRTSVWFQVQPCWKPNRASFDAQQLYYRWREWFWKRCM